MYSLEDIFGINTPALHALNGASPEAPPAASSSYTTAEPAQVGGAWHASFTDWKASPTFWLALFAVFALGLLHVEANVRSALGGARVGLGR